MTQPILDISGLHVEFPGRAKNEVVRAVDGVDLSVAPGEVVALVGESGCGKTTTANAALGLVPPTSGSLRVNGIDIAGADRRGLKSARQSMQMIAQDPYESLNPRMTIEEIVLEPLVVHGLVALATTQRAIDALTQAGLTPAVEFLGLRSHQLSGGQRQRVVIAAALSIEPTLIIADEPVSMLDVSVRAGILNLLQSLAETRQIGILMITHDLSTVAAYSHRIAVMYLGQIVETGRTLEVIANPRHPYTEALLSVVPNHDPSHHRTPILLSGETPDASRIPSGCRFHPPLPEVVRAVPDGRARSDQRPGIARDGLPPGESPGRISPFGSHDPQAGTARCRSLNHDDQCDNTPAMGGPAPRPARSDRHRRSGHGNGDRGPHIRSRRRVGLVGAGPPRRGARRLLYQSSSDTHHDKARLPDGSGHRHPALNTDLLTRPAKDHGSPTATGSRWP